MADSISGNVAITGPGPVFKFHCSFWQLLVEINGPRQQPRHGWLATPSEDGRQFVAHPFQGTTIIAIKAIIGINASCCWVSMIFLAIDMLGSLPVLPERVDDANTT